VLFLYPFFNFKEEKQCQTNQKQTFRTNRQISLNQRQNPSDEEKAELEEFRKWKESQKSEIEKQTAAYQKSEKARIEAENRISDYEAKFAALKNGVSADSVDDVVALAKLKTDKNTSLEQAIESVLEKYPQFRGKGITTGVHTSNNSDKMSGVEAAFYAKNPDLKA